MKVPSVQRKSRGDGEVGSELRTLDAAMQAAGSEKSAELLTPSRNTR